MSEIETRKYRCLCVVRHNGKRNEVGAIIELSSKQAGVLVALKAVAGPLVENLPDKSGDDSGSETDSLINKIVLLIPNLNKDSDFTVAGPPKVASVSKALGRDVTSDDVYLAWSEFQVSEGK